MSRTVGKWNVKKKKMFTVVCLYCPRLRDELVCMANGIHLYFVFRFAIVWLCHAIDAVGDNGRRWQWQLGDVVYSDLPRVRLDGGGRQFRRRWGYDGCGSVGGGGPGSLNGGAGHLEDIEEDGDDISDTYSLRGEACYGSHLHDGESLSELFLDLVSAIPIFLFPLLRILARASGSGWLLLASNRSSWNAVARRTSPFPSYPHRHRQLPKYEDEFMVHCYRLREPFSGGEKWFPNLKNPWKKQWQSCKEDGRNFCFIRLNEGRARCQTPTRHRRLLFCFFSSSCSSLIIRLKRRSTNQKWRNLPIIFFSVTVALQVGHLLPKK